jgi:hypothetical protein
MNEEEKKAVEFVKKRTKELKKYAKRENELVYDDIILNLIEKLQKENEEYSKQLDLDYVDKNYIPIQKVKDKIRKNEEIIDISNDGDLIHELYQKNKVYEELLDKEN